MGWEETAALLNKYLPYLSFSLSDVMAVDGLSMAYNEAMWQSKFGNLWIREILVVVSAYTHSCRLWGRGRGVARKTHRGRRMLFSGREIVRCQVGQPAFFLAGNHMTIVACLSLLKLT